MLVSPISCAVPVQPAALRLLAALSKVLAHWGRWYVFGAQAVIAYGVPRLSADVDVTLELVPDEPERFVREMEAAGFALRVDDPDFVRRTRVMPFVHLATAMPLDIVLAGSGLEAEFLDRARATRSSSGVFADKPWTPAASGGRCASSRKRSARATCSPSSRRS